MKVITVQTMVQVILGVVDEEGDVVQKHPLNLEIAKLTEQTWKEVLAKVEESKERLKHGNTQS